MMSNHSSRSKEMLLVSILGVLLGGTATAFLMSKEGKKLKENVEGTYLKVRENIDDVLQTLEEKLEESVDEKSEEWSETVRETIDEIKNQVKSVNLFEPKDLGMVILLFTLLGALLGAGTTLMVQERRREEDDLFHGIASRLSTAKPLISELRSLLNETSRSRSSEDLDSPKLGATTNDLLEFALLGLKLWDRVKNRNR